MKLILGILVFAAATICVDAQPAPLLLDSIPPQAVQEVIAQANQTCSANNGWSCSSQGDDNFFRLLLAQGLSGPESNWRLSEPSQDDKGNFLLPNAGGANPPNGPGLGYGELWTMTPDGAVQKVATVANRVECSVSGDILVAIRKITSLGVFNQKTRAFYFRTYAMRDSWQGSSLSCEEYLNGGRPGTQQESAMTVAIVRVRGLTN